MTYKNTFGHVFQMHTFGESHGEALGVTIDGCPSGLAVDESLLLSYLNRRRPGQNQFVTARNESDQYKILSGVLENKTLGTPITLIFENTNQRSQDYKDLKPRDGHADQTWSEKYEHVDLRGGGRSSGRETVSRVASGAFARMFLYSQNPNLKINVWIEQAGPFKNQQNYKDFSSDFDYRQGLKRELSFPDQVLLPKLQEALIQAKEQGESYGGEIRIQVENLDSGLGQPVFSKLKSDLASALFSIGAVTGVGLGDIDVFKPGTKYHNNKQAYGGVQGGISSGEDLSLSVLFKPTSSILDVAQKGRHDPCILPRAVVVVEAMVAMVLADHYLLKRLDNI